MSGEFIQKYRIGDKVYYGDPELLYEIVWSCPSGDSWVYDIKGFGYAGHTWVDESELSEYTLKERVARLEKEMGFG